MGVPRDDETFDPGVTAARSIAGDSEAPRSVAPGLCPPYVADGLVARGGMGSVYRGLDTRLERTVAVKTLDAALSHRDDLVKRFILEAQITGGLEHPNIVPVHLLGEDADGLPCFSMKLVEGNTLSREIHHGAGLPWPSGRLDRLVEVLVKVCDAVAFAHSRGVVHGDIKPLNVMVGEFGQVYVMDWGVARVLDAAAFGRHDVETPEKTYDANGRERPQLFGTPAYMAPEQAIGVTEFVDTRTDVFMLGAVLYEMLTGTAPHQGQNVMEVVWNAARCEITPPELRAPGLGLPEGLCRTAMRALAAQRSDRYTTVLAFKADLERYLRGLDRFPVVRFAPGDLVIEEGTPGEDAYLIESGRCLAFKTVEGRKVPLREMGPGEVFGETAVFTAKPRTASIEAIETLVLLRVTRSALSAQLGLDSHSGAFVRALAERFRQLDERLAAYERERITLEPPTPSFAPPAPDDEP